jgi:hypothetical protein
MIIKKTRNKKYKYKILQDGGAVKPAQPNTAQKTPSTVAGNAALRFRSFRKGNTKTRKVFKTIGEVLYKTPGALAIAPIGLATGVIAGVSKVSAKKHDLKMQKYKTEKQVQEVQYALSKDKYKYTGTGTTTKEILAEIEKQKVTAASDPTKSAELAKAEAQYKVLDALETKQKLIKYDQNQAGSWNPFAKGARFTPANYLREMYSQTKKAVVSPYEYLATTPTRVLQHSLGLVPAVFSPVTQGTRFHDAIQKGLSPRWLIKSGIDKIITKRFTGTKEGLSYYGSTLKRKLATPINWISRGLGSNKTSARISTYLSEDSKRAERIARKIDEDLEKIKYGKLQVSKLESLSYLSPDKQLELNRYRSELEQNLISLEKYKKYHDKILNRIKHTESLIGNKTSKNSAFSYTTREGLYKLGEKKYLDILNNDMVYEKVNGGLELVKREGIDKKAGDLKNETLKYAVENTNIKALQDFITKTLPEFKALKEKELTGTLNLTSETQRLEELQKQIFENSIFYSNALTGYSKILEVNVGLYRENVTSDLFKQYSKDLMDFYKYNTERNLLDVYRQSAEALKFDINVKKLDIQDQLNTAEKQRLFNTTGNQKKNDRLERLSYLQSAELQDTSGKPKTADERIEAAKTRLKTIQTDRKEKDILLENIKKDPRFEGQLNYDLVKGVARALDLKVVEEVFNSKDIYNADQFRAALILKLEEKRKADAAAIASGGPGPGGLQPVVASSSTAVPTAAVLTAQPAAQPAAQLAVPTALTAQSAPLAVPSVPVSSGPPVAVVSGLQPAVASSQKAAVSSGLAVQSAAQLAVVSSGQSAAVSSGLQLTEAAKVEKPNPNFIYNPLYLESKKVLGEGNSEYPNALRMSQSKTSAELQENAVKNNKRLDEIKLMLAQQQKGPKINPEELKKLEAEFTLLVNRRDEIKQKEQNLSSAAPRAASIVSTKHYNAFLQPNVVPNVVRGYTDFTSKEKPKEKPNKLKVKKGYVQLEPERTTNSKTAELKTQLKTLTNAVTKQRGKIKFYFSKIKPETQLQLKQIDKIKNQIKTIEIEEIKNNKWDFFMNLFRNSKYRNLELAQSNNPLKDILGDKFEMYKKNPAVRKNLFEPYQQEAIKALNWLAQDKEFNKIASKLMS